MSKRASIVVDYVRVNSFEFRLGNSKLAKKRKTKFAFYESLKLKLRQKRFVRRRRKKKRFREEKNKNAKEQLGKNGNS